MKRLGTDFFDDAEDRWRIYRDLPPRPQIPRMPFGKYKNQPVQALRQDRRYADWLMAQDWFREKYPKLVQIIVNFGEAK
jgi:uncharacterized protein (DUF3820 family)